MRALCWRGGLAACALAGAAGGASAQLAEAANEAAHNAEVAALAGPPPALRVELTQTQSLPAPASMAAEGGAATDRAVQTMLWAHHGVFGFGMGLEQRSRQPVMQGAEGAQFAGQNLLLGVSLATGPNSQITWQIPPELANGGDPRFGEAAPLRVSWSFRTTDRYREFFRGSLLKVELSSQTAIALRARGGRIGFQLTSQW